MWRAPIRLVMPAAHLHHFLLDILGDTIARRVVWTCQWSVLGSALMYSVLVFLQDPHVDCYKVSAIKDRLGLDRESLVGLAILLGCDYVPKVRSACIQYM